MRKSLLNTLLTVAGKAPAAMIPFLIALWFGIGPLTDTYFLVYSVVIFVAQFISGSVRPIVVPFVCAIRSEQQAPVVFISNALVATVSLATLAGIAFCILGPILICFVSAVDSEYNRLIGILSWELCLLIPIMGCNSLLGGSLNACQRFYFVTAAPMVAGLVAILAMFFGKGQLGIHSLCLGQVAGQGIVGALLLRRVCRVVGPIALTRQFLTPQTVEFLKVVLFQTLAIVVWSINPVVDNVMVSYLGIGSISRLEYAYKLVHVPLSLVSAGTVVVFFSHLAELYHQRGLEVLRRKVVRIITALLAFTVTLTVLLWFGADFIIQLVYGHNETVTESLAEITGIFRYCCFLLPAHLIGLVFVRYFMITRQTGYVFRTSLVSFAANIIFNYIFMRALGARGIALSTTCVMAVQCVVLSILFRGKRPTPLSVPEKP